MKKDHSTKATRAKMGKKRDMGIYEGKKGWRLMTRKKRGKWSNGKGKEDKLRRETKGNGVAKNGGRRFCIMWKIREKKLRLQGE